MTTLILGVDSGLDGAFVWMRGGDVTHHLLTRTLVKDGAIDMDLLGDHSASVTVGAGSMYLPRIAYLEEPFNASLSGGASTSGYTDQCKHWGRLQGWLESWGYEVRGVQAKTWQRELLDLGRFEVRREKGCAPRLAEGWKLNRVSGSSVWRLRSHSFDQTFAWQITRAELLHELWLAQNPAVIAHKSVLSHDTKAASIAYAREHYPGVALVPPRSRNPHDGLADAICIAAWASKQLNKET